MSNFYLCNACANCKQLWEWAHEVDCKAGHDTAKVMYDHHGRGGRGGRRYDDPTDVCEHFEPKEDK